MIQVLHMVFSVSECELQHLTECNTACEETNTVLKGSVNSCVYVFIVSSLHSFFKYCCLFSLSLVDVCTHLLLPLFLSASLEAQEEAGQTLSDQVAQLTLSCQVSRSLQSPSFFMGEGEGG